MRDAGRGGAKADKAATGLLLRLVDVALDVCSDRVDGLVDSLWSTIHELKVCNAAPH